MDSAVPTDVDASQEIAFPLKGSDLFLQRDHFELTSDHDLFELLKVEDLLLQLGFGCF